MVRTNAIGSQRNSQATRAMGRYRLRQHQPLNTEPSSNAVAQQTNIPGHGSRFCSHCIPKNDA